LEEPEDRWKTTPSESIHLINCLLQDGDHPVAVYYAPRLLPSTKNVHAFQRQQGQCCTTFLRPTLKAPRMSAASSDNYKKT